MSSNFKNKVITITGAASGVGRALAILLAERGAKVSLCDVTGPALDTVVKEIEMQGGTAFGLAIDIRNRQQVEAWIQQTVSRYGRLDGSANVAGVGGRDLGNADLLDIDDADFDFVIDVNVKGLLHCMRAQVANMNSPGSICNVSSLAGTLGFEKHFAYNASKHAVNGLSKCAAKELAKKNIRVNVIAP